MNNPNQQDQLAQSFCQHYQLLAEIIAEANRYGSTPGLESRYHKHRTWLQANYHHLKPQVSRHLNQPPADQFHWHRPLDDFEQLLKSPTLAHSLSAANLNQLLTNTQGAVELTFRPNPSLIS